MTEVTIYTDGGCRPNPGKGGWAAILAREDLVAGKVKLELSGGFRRTTNNRMELMAAIKSLEALKRPCSVKLHSDSQYLINAISKGWISLWRQRHWRRKGDLIPNHDLWRRLAGLLEIHRVDPIWVRGHNGDETNEACDKMAELELLKDDLPIDAGFEVSEVFQ